MQHRTEPLSFVLLPAYNYLTKMDPVALRVKNKPMGRKRGLSGVGRVGRQLEGKMQGSDPRAVLFLFGVLGPYPKSVGSSRAYGFWRTDFELG